MSNKLTSTHSFTVMPKDCNFNINVSNNKNDILFGGKLLYEMDYAGAKVVRRATYGVDLDMFVTASVDKINFEKPSFLGDIISMEATIKSLGRSSVGIKVVVSRESLRGETEQVCSANMTFVTMKNGRSTPHLLNFEKLSE